MKPPSLSGSRERLGAYDPAPLLRRVKQLLGGPLRIAFVWLAVATQPALAESDPRAVFVQGLFSGQEQYEVFNRLTEIFPFNTMTASPTPKPLPQGEPFPLPSNYEYEGAAKDASRFLEETDTVALLVLHDGNLVHESYWLTGGVDVHWMSMSVGKSFVSALVGIAQEEGLFDSIEDPITRYVPQLNGSAYEGVRIKDVLQMSSGARWNEDYSDPESDIMRFIRVFGSGASINEFAASLVRARPPGTLNLYNSTDTQALGMLVNRVTGQSLAAYAEAKLWHPLGMESTGYWITDDLGMEMAAGGLQVTARDYAKFGELYRNGGRAGDRQIVSAEWVKASTTPDAPHLMPGVDPAYPLGYGYQWWIPPGEEGEFAAIGVYNQFIYVNPTRNLVIVKLSASSDYGQTNDDSSWREMESIALFRKIGEGF
jgi:CubicO group peptidase (beta-lactamase class C family)